MPYKDKEVQREYFRLRNKRRYNNKCLDCGDVCHETSSRCKPCSKLKKYRNPSVRQKGWAKKINGVYLQRIATRIRDLVEYSEWRLKVFRRDRFVCQMCLESGKVLNAHHVVRMKRILVDEGIDTIAKAISCSLLWDINNGVTLCHSCHKKVHKL